MRLLFLVSVTFILFFRFNSLASDLQKDQANNYNADSAKYFLESSQKKTLYLKEYWLLLLHYNNGKSSIDDDFFFLDKNGYKYPEKELYQTIREFFRTDIPLDDNHPICRYPARLKWLKKELDIPDKIIPKPDCKALKLYLQSTNADSIYLAFASENVNNLMSMMGHIFLKIEGRKNDLTVSNSLSYFAKFSPSDSVSFIFKSLFIGVPGVYVIEPYKKKVSEYNFQQKRSVWEYKLNFTQEQINSLMLHIWEMKRVNAKYKFITHNCGNALLNLLYLADPSLKSVYSPLDSPLDIVKNINKKGLISKVEIIPSDNYKFRMLSDNFSNYDKKIIADLLRRKEFSMLNGYKNLPQHKSNLLYGLNTALSYKFSNDEIAQSDYEDLLNKITLTSEALPKNNLVYDIKNPLQKSDSSRLSFGYGYQDNNLNSLKIGFYPVYNSIDGNNSSYFNEFDLQLMNLEASYFTNKNKARIENIDLVKIKSIIPYDPIINGFSGGFRINLEREDFDYKSKKIFPNSDVSVGIGKEFLNKRILAYSMINLGYSYFDKNNVVYVAPEFGAIIKNIDYGKLNIQYKNYYSGQNYKYSSLIKASQSLFLKENHDLILSCQKIKSDTHKSSKGFSIDYQYHF